MTAKMYLELVEKHDASDVADVIDTLSNEERRALREELELEGCEKLVRNLFYNYDSQEWI